MSREELSEAIHDLASTPHMSTYALEHAMAALDLEELKQLFDTVADHHELTDQTRRDLRETAMSYLEELRRRR